MKKETVVNVWKGEGHHEDMKRDWSKSKLESETYAKRGVLLLTCWTNSWLGGHTSE